MAMSQLFKEFLGFIKNFGVVGLALGVIIGSATNNLVNSLVSNIFNPILGKVVGVKNLESFVVWDIKIGSFISELINFTLILFIVYVAIRFFINRFMTEKEKEKFEFLKGEEKETKKDTGEKEA